MALGQLKPGRSGIGGVRDHDLVDPSPQAPAPK
jgi:hypothetical protein